jgi:DNA-binding transcriptional MerR regulator
MDAALSAGKGASKSERPPAADKGHGPHVYKMKDLCDKAGVSRQVVHFYIQQGLLPEGKKTGKNMAYYSDEHLERLLLVRKLQHEHFLPLKAIRALLEERDEAFSPAQQKHMREVRAELSDALVSPSGPRPTLDVDAITSRLGLPRADVDEMVEAGVLAVADEEDLKTGQRRTVIARDDAWLLELYAELRAAGLTPERGFRARDLVMYDEAVQRLVAKEARLIAARLGSASPAEVAGLLERAMPIVGSLLARLHGARAKDFFATL